MILPVTGRARTFVDVKSTTANSTAVASTVLTGCLGLMRRLAWVPLVLAVAHRVSAEVMWLQPERFAVTPGATLWVEVAVGSRFANGDGRIVSLGVRVANGALGGRPLPAVSVSSTPAPRLNVTVPRPGVAALTVELHERCRDLPRVEVESYLRAIHATDELRSAWAEMPESRPWRERQSIRLKTFVRVGEPAEGDRQWAEPHDAGLDIVPECDPTALRNDEDLSVRVLRAGRPVGGAVLSFVSLGETREHVVVADEDGRVAAKLDAAGDWLVRGVVLRRVMADDHDWRSEVVALTVTVR